MAKQPTQITAATELSAVQAEISALQEREKKLKTALLTNLKKQGVKSIRLADGSSYTIAERQVLKVKAGEEDAAQLWAEDNYCMKIDTAKALKIVRRSLKKPPKFFVVGSTEYLTVRKAGEKLTDKEE